MIRRSRQEKPYVQKDSSCSEEGSLFKEPFMFKRAIHGQKSIHVAELLIVKLEKKDIGTFLWNT